MTKTELAESMAEFLEFKGHRPLSAYHVSRIFCPVGFFAVWDKLDENHDWSKGTARPYQLMRGVMESHYNEEYERDRYTAFYSAVHEIRTAK